MNRVTATFSIWSPKLRPDKISQMLEFTPDNFAIKGVERSPPRSRPLDYGWHVSNKELNQVLPGEVLDRLISRIEPFSARIALLQNDDPEARITFHLTIAPKDADVGIFFEEKTIAFISSLQGSLNVEFFDLLPENVIDAKRKS